jgi:hypothetical protein
METKFSQQAPIKTYVSSRKRSPNIDQGPSDELQNEQYQLDVEIKRLN